jgi:hypothetical protein
MSRHGQRRFSMPRAGADGPAAQESDVSGFLVTRLLGLRWAQQLSAMPDHIGTNDTDSLPRIPVDPSAFDDCEGQLRVGCGWQIAWAQTPLASRIVIRTSARRGGIMGQPTLWSHRVTLAPQATSVSIARAFIRERLLEHELALLVDDVRLVGSELATNATLHARTPFTVQLESDGRSVRLTVSDGLLLLPVLVAAAPMAPGGRGLGIVAACSRDWGVSEAGRNNKKSVWASFDVP